MQAGFNCQQLAGSDGTEEKRGTEKGGPASCTISLVGTPDVEADAIVGVGDGTDDAPVPLTGQAPLTGTPVVDPIDGLWR